MELPESELSQELARIVACPYPPSLKTVADILARSDDRAVRTCIHHLSSCATTRLASIVSVSLSLFSYSLRILQALCHSMEFRDILLKDNPGLLDALLTKANTSQHEFDEYGQLCVLLLSRPLPAAISLPASAQSFFLRLFDKATKAPDVDTLKPIYSSLNGACRGLLGLLSPEARHAFDKQLCQILQSNATSQNSMLLLWCIGIVILAEHPRDAGRTRSSLSTFATPSEVTLERQWKTASGRKLFGSTVGLSKTITLTYLSVIWASKGDVGVSDMEAIEGIRIATRAMQLADREVREGWPSSSSLAKNMAPKLVSKIQRQGIDAGVKLEALCFYATMVGKSNLSAEVIAEYEAVLLDVQSLHTDGDCLKETLSHSLPLFEPRLRESTICFLLAKILNTSSSCERPDELMNASILVQELTALIPNCVALSSQLLSALSSNELQESVRSFLRATAEYHSEGPGEKCNTSVRLLRHTLQSATVSMLLTSALTAPSTGRGLSQTLALALIDKQRELAQPPKQCNHPTTSPQPAVSLFEQECTPSAGVHQQDWRGHLKSELERQSSYQRDSVIRSVALICENLESRCSNVEEPLRREQAKVQDLTAQVSLLKEQIQSLETEAVDRRLYVDGLEAEIGNVENEKEDVSTKLAELKVDFARANREADQALRAAQEEFNAKELQFRSMILTHEENLHSRGQEVENLNAQMQEFRDKEQKGHEEKEYLRERHETLKADYDALEHDLGMERQNTAQQAEQIVQLKHSRSDLENNLHCTKKELDGMSDQRNDLQARYDELVRSSEHALRNLEAKYEDDIETAISKANDKYNQLHAEMQDAKRDGQQAKTAYEDTQRDLQLVQATVKALEEKVQRLTDTCAGKDDELSDLKAWRSRVLTSMGLSADNPLPIRPDDQPGKHERNLTTSRQHRRRRSAVQPQDIAPTRDTTGNQSISSTAMENIANASFSSDSSSRTGSTPKRPKPRPSFKIPAMHTPYRQKPGGPSRLISKQTPSPGRSVLGPASPNRRHTTVGFAISEKEEYDEDANGTRGGTLHLGEQASFDMDGFLASTPFTPGNITCGTGRGPEEVDGETTEF